MDFFLEFDNLILVVIAIASAAMLAMHTARKGSGGNTVSVQQAIQLANREHGIFVDIRSADQFRAGSIAQARNIPRDELDDKATSLPKDKPVILICDSGQQTQAAVTKLRKQGVDGAVSMQGGLRSWVQEGLPLVKKG